MCAIAPLMAASVLMSALAIQQQYQTAQNAADAQEEYNDVMVKEQNEYMRRNADLANKAYFDKSAQENLRLAQTRQSTAEDIEQSRIEADRKVGTAMASAKSFGSSVAADIFRDQARYSSNMKTNLTWEDQQVRMNLEGFRAEAHDRVNSVRPYIPSPVNRPSALGAFAQFGASAAQSGMTYMAYKKQGVE